MNVLQGVAAKITYLLAGNGSRANILNYLKQEAHFVRFIMLMIALSDFIDQLHLPHNS
jgi:hypothetical protein